MLAQLPIPEIAPRAVAGVLPRERYAPNLGPPRGQEANELEGIKFAKLLMVDDEPINLRVFEKHLRGFGYENFVTTTDSSSAFALIQREEPDLALLDIAMPRVNGLDLLRQIRGAERGRRLPVMILTAYSDPATRREAFDAGCSDFLSKPVDPCELALRVRNLLHAKAFADHVAQHADRLEAEVERQAEALAAARLESESRYHAGKAELATEVLHNVGNALQSVNVGVDLLKALSRNSKIPNLVKGAELLREHAGDLPRYLTQNEQGRVLPEYLCDLAETLRRERDKMADELDSLTRHLAHIHAVVATQQKYAGTRRIREEVAISELLSDLDGLLGGSLARKGIQVVRDCPRIPSPRTERQKLLQVMLNVVKNAEESIHEAHPQGGGRLTVRAGVQGTGRVFLEIQDNGVGIPRENLIRMFAHGFTTKRDGHGFGLHSCANLIQELGGSIQAHSDGIGLGATMRLEIPLDQEDH